MKAKIIFALFLGAIVVSFSACQKNNNSAKINNYEYVDLGLPSGTLWATCNVGATKPELAGYFFAWGETKPKTEYSWKNYKWYDSNGNPTEYYGKDGKQKLEPEDDAATANWGKPWRTPTMADFKELFLHTTLTSYANKTYCVLTSKLNGNSITIPMVGWIKESQIDDEGYNGIYWTSTLETKWFEPEIVIIESDIESAEAHYETEEMDGYEGCSVRPVCIK